jgi:hypothetical protein
MGLSVTGQAIDQITLLGDIGATNARFALLTAGVLGPVKWIEVARYSKFAHAIEDFLQSQFFQSPVSYPARPVRWIVGIPPGDTPDILARLIPAFRTDDSLLWSERCDSLFPEHF